MVGATALATANTKLTFGFGQAVALGVLCNTLVCLAVWRAFSARSARVRRPIAYSPSFRPSPRSSLHGRRCAWRRRGHEIGGGTAYVAWSYRVGEGCTLITRTSGVLGPCNVPQPLWQLAGRTVT